MCKQRNEIGSEQGRERWSGNLLKGILGHLYILRNEVLASNWNQRYIVRKSWWVKIIKQHLAQISQDLTAFPMNLQKLANRLSVKENYTVPIRLCRWHGSSDLRHAQFSLHSFAQRPTRRYSMKVSKGYQGKLTFCFHAIRAFNSVGPKTSTISYSSR